MLREARVRAQHNEVHADAQRLGSSGDALYNSASPPHTTSTKLILDVNVPGRYHAHA